LSHNVVISHIRKKITEALNASIALVIMIILCIGVSSFLAIVCATPPVPAVAPWALPNLFRLFSRNKKKYARRRTG
jgi:hypothetical protein